MVVDLTLSTLPYLTLGTSGHLHHAAHHDSHSLTIELRYEKDWGLPIDTYLNDLRFPLFQIC